jgi:hypothetical protein
VQNCAEWLHYRCDISRSAAREKVRVAHALKTLPAIGRAFAEGKLSYSKVRAQAHRALRLRHDPHRGTFTITVELPVETGELVDKALDRALEAVGVSEAGPELAGESWSAQRADALVALAKAYLGGSGRQERGSGTPHHYQVMVHVEESALRGSAGRSGLPIETVRRLACDSDLLVLVEDRNGEPLSVGRKTRVVPAAINRALWARDGGCRFPGCVRKRFVEAHHIEHWASGGETSLASAEASRRSPPVADQGPISTPL